MTLVIFSTLLAVPYASNPEFSVTDRMNPVTKLDSPLQFAEFVVAELQGAGYEAFFAGGCVRDQILGLPPKDFDVATSATPRQVRALFGHGKTIPLGMSFGVITVVGPPGAGQIEVATFRQDSGYSDGRRPDQVTFSSAVEDARRRDFTINGMFYDPRTKQVVDYVGGERDIERGLIRAIGDADARFDEDKLRMLRAVRFASTYSFAIEPATLRAIQRRTVEIRIVSQERITQELTRMWVHPQRRRALELLHESGLLHEVLPDLANRFEQHQEGPLLALVERLEDPICQETFSRVPRLQSPVSFATVLAAILGPLGADLTTRQEPKQTIEQTCRKLKFSNEVRQGTDWLVHAVPRIQRAHLLAFSELQPVLIHPGCAEAWRLAYWTSDVTGGPVQGIERVAEMLHWPSDRLNPPLLLHGDDLATLQIEPGPIYARILQRVRAQQLDGEIDSVAEALELAREIVRQPPIR